MCASLFSISFALSSWVLQAMRLLPWGLAEEGGAPMMIPSQEHSSADSHERHPYHLDLI